MEIGRLADIPVTVAEMSGFIRDAERLLSAGATRELVTFVAWHPDAGDLIPETGGVRKLRWARDGMGKRGGVRMIYYFHDGTMPIYLLAIYGKNEKANLSAAEKAGMRKRVAELVRLQRRGRA